MPPSRSRFRLPGVAIWRDVLWPREHGSWSLALEPLAFGLLAAPAAHGVGLAVVVAAAFFSRRPLRLAVGGAGEERTWVARLAFVGCGGVVVLGLGWITGRCGWAWLAWLVPTLVGGAIFLWYDLRDLGRERLPEVAGAGAFAAVPAALATLAGWSPWAAASLGLIMVGRAAPTVLCVRAVLREKKTGESHRTAALAAAGVALVGGIALAAVDLAPWVAVAALAVLAGRAGLLLCHPRPELRARTLGLIEALLGLAFVVVVAAAWRS